MIRSVFLFTVVVTKVDTTQSLEFHRCTKTGGERLAHHGELLKILVAEALRADELEEAIQRLACTTHETARKQAYYGPGVNSMHTAHRTHLPQ